MAVAIRELGRKLANFRRPINIDKDIQKYLKRCELGSPGAERETRENLESLCKRLVENRLVPQVPTEWKEGNQVRKFHGAVLEVATLEGEEQELDRGFRKRQVVALEIHGRLVRLDKVYDMNDASQTAIRYMCEGAPQELKGADFMHVASHAYMTIAYALQQKRGPIPEITLPVETTA